MWLLTAEVKKAIEQAQASSSRPSAEQYAAFEARAAARDGGASRILSVAGDVAEIRVEGVLTKAPSFMAMLFGGGNATYPELISALAEADQDPSVTRAELRVDSPGGTIDGLFDAIAALQAFSKPLRAVVTNTAASAAYALVSQADEIVAANKAARVGSIGVVIDTYNDPERVSITSTDAPKKRPDIGTEAGKAVVREELDALHEIFVEAIAEGRSTTAEKINAEFGQGATLLAGEALKRGMIDAVVGTTSTIAAESPSSKSTAITGGGNLETEPMDLKTLKAQHPDVFAAALQEGVEKERDRVSAHMTMGEAAGAMDIAAKAIADGEEYTAKHMAQYNAAALRSRDQQDRQSDDAAAGAAANGAAPAADEGGTDADAVCAIVEAQLGITGE